MSDSLVMQIKLMYEGEMHVNVKYQKHYFSLMKVLFCPELFLLSSPMSHFFTMFLSIQQITMNVNLIKALSFLSK